MKPGAVCFCSGATSWSRRDRNSLRIGELFDWLSPTAKSIVGGPPSSGRLGTRYWRNVRDPAIEDQVAYPLVERRASAPSTTSIGRWTVHVSLK